MKSSKYLYKILTDLRTTQPEEVDTLLLLHGGDKVKSEIPFETLLGQFRYCLDNNVRNECYVELKRLLSSICSEPIINEVEDLYCV